MVVLVLVLGLAWGLSSLTAGMVVSPSPSSSMVQSLASASCSGLRGSARSVLAMAGAGSAKDEVDLRPKEYRNLEPLPCYGVWQPNKELWQNAMFLVPEQMVVRERVDGNVLARDIMPLPIPANIEFGLGAAMKSASTDTIFNGWSGAGITDRSDGIYDHLDKVLSWPSRSVSRARRGTSRGHVSCVSSTMDSPRFSSTRRTLTTHAASSGTWRSGTGSSASVYTASSPREFECE